MTKNLQILDYNKHPIRQTVSEDGEILFCAFDVAQALGYRDSDRITRLLDKDEPPQIVGALDSKGELRNTPFITEHQLYGILMALRTERTKPFRHWVTHEVLPSIRKTGSYNLNQTAEISYRNKLISPAKAEDLLKAKDEEIKDLRYYKRKDDHTKSLAADYREDHRKMKLAMVNIRTGKMSTLWNLPYDVMLYLKNLSKVQRGQLFDRWKNQHNFNEFIRFRMKKEGFKI